VVIAGAVVMASHRNWLAGFGFDGFFGALLYELGMQSSPDIRVKHRCGRALVFASSAVSSTFERSVACVSDEHEGELG
jgi:hypothetical protein